MDCPTFWTATFFFTLYRSPQNTIAAIKETDLTFKLFRFISTKRTIAHDLIKTTTSANYLGIAQTQGAIVLPDLLLPSSQRNDSYY